MTKVRQALGEWGERVAAAHLVATGMVLLDRNWRTASGEIDIIARDVNAVIFCEQKLQDLRQVHRLLGASQCPKAANHSRVSDERGH